MLPRLAMANGVALGPDGKALWATEFARNLLHRIELADATTIAPLGSAIAYHFTGPAPDSMRADADGNLDVWARPRSGLQQERNSHRPGSVAGPGTRTSSAIHQHGHPARHE
ncbi:hypothetical protein [Azotobacter beijerinckii]|uniref:hypothetical protein n=1 Tax=Azotobacter beijerinckii TaxID=170623 RepID=UPI000A9483CC|nr:hypothetical protein [Azotobacter beijerinckii]